MQPNIFKEAEDYLRQIFKVHSKGTVNMLSRQRVSRARTMMTPFVLRRRKAQVLLDLPPRTERIVECRMTPLQQDLYDNALRKNRSIIEEVKDDDEDDGSAAVAKKDPKAKDDTSTNVLMDLRKAASHPLLFRSRYNDATLRKLAKAALKEEEFKTSVEKLVIEDMEVNRVVSQFRFRRLMIPVQIMTDAELHFFCKAHPKVGPVLPSGAIYRSDRLACRVQYCGKFALDEKIFWDVGKMEELKTILDDSAKHNKRILLFSQVG